MKKYEIGFNYDVSATCIVEARSEAEAMHIMQETLANDGIDGLNIDVTDRSYGANTSEDKSHVNGLSAGIADGDFQDEYPHDFKGQWEMRAYYIDGEEHEEEYAEESFVVEAMNEDDARAQVTELAKASEKAKHAVNLTIVVELD